MSQDATQPAVVLTEQELRDALRQSGVAAIRNDLDRGRELDERILSSHVALAAQVEQLIELARRTAAATDDAESIDTVEEDLDRILATGVDEARGLAVMQGRAFLVGLRMTLERLPADPLTQTPVSRAFLKTVEETVAKLSGDRGAHL